MGYLSASMAYIALGVSSDGNVQLIGTERRIEQGAGTSSQRS